jgi:hypothetical protein
MRSCADCRELLLEDLYGLLEPAQAEALHAHLAECPACREARAQAERQQQLLARAARIYQQVPAFAPPSSGPARPTPAAETAPAVVPPPARKWPIWRWTVTAAAAAVLLAAAGLFALYQHGLSQRQEELADARRRVKNVETKLADVQTDLERDKANLLTQLRNEYFQLEVDGPAVCLPGAPARFHVRARDLLDNRPLAAAVSARLVRRSKSGAEKVVFEQKAVTRDGQATLTLPADAALPAASLAHLEIEAKGPGGTQTLRQDLMIEQPTYLAQLVTSKPAGKPGEVLFFRALILERFRLRPPGRPVPLRWTLTDPQGKVVWQQAQSCQPDGVAAGRLVLAPNLADGEHILRLAPTGSDRFPPQSRLLYVRRGSEAERRPAGPARDKLEVDFFPEGGELVAGVPSRVYFRVRTGPGQPAQLDGRVVDRQGRTVAQVRTGPTGRLAAEEALGVFKLTPEAGQSYRLQITSPAGVKEEPVLPEVQAQGLGLTVANGVAREGEPIRVTVRNTGKERLLLVLAECRGQVVDERFVRVGPAGREVRLDPAQGTSGVVRVTIYDPAGGRLLPLAERLVYRQPTRKLELSLGQLGRTYHPRQVVALPVQAKAETGKLVPAHLLAVIVDQRALAASGKEGELGPPAHFYLVGSVPDAAHLEDANFLVGDSAPAREGLELFLGAYGWRRFVPTEGGPRLALAGTPAVFYRSNVETMRALYNSALARRQQELTKRADQRRAVLLRDKERDEEAVRVAVAALADYEQLPAQYIHLGLGLLAVALLGIGALALGLGLVRAVRGRAATGSLAVAFAALGLCLLLYVLRGDLQVGVSDNRRNTTDQLAWKEQRGQPQAGETLKKAPAPPGLPNGILAAATAPKAALNQADRLARSPLQRRSALAHRFEEDKGTVPGVKKAQAALEALRGPAPGGGAGAVPGAVPPPGAPRLGSAAAPRKLGPAVAADSFQAAPVLRQYIHKASALRPDRQDLLLWMPDLNLADGQATLHFTLSDLVTDYRVLLFGHDAAGRLGFAEGTLRVQPASK